MISPRNRGGTRNSPEIDIDRRPQNDVGITHTQMGGCLP